MQERRDKYLCAREDMTPLRRFEVRLVSLELCRFRASSFRPVPVPPCPRNSLATHFSDHAPASSAFLGGESQSTGEAGNGICIFRC